MSSYALRVIVIRDHGREYLAAVPTDDNQSSFQTVPWPPEAGYSLRPPFLGALVNWVKSQFPGAKFFVAPIAPVP